MSATEDILSKLQVLIGFLAVFAPKRLLGMDFGMAADVGRDAIGRDADGTPILWTDGEGLWGVSFAGPNPTDDQVVVVHSRGDAERLIHLVVSAHLGP